MHSSKQVLETVFPATTGRLSVPRGPSAAGNHQGLQTRSSAAGRRHGSTMDRRIPYGEIRLMTVLLDLNVVLDVLLVRKPWCDDSAAIWDANSQRQIDAFISSASFPTHHFYLVHAHRGRSLAQRGHGLSEGGNDRPGRCFEPPAGRDGTGGRLRGQPPGRFRRGGEARSHRYADPKVSPVPRFPY